MKQHSVKKWVFVVAGLLGVSFSQAGQGDSLQKDGVPRAALLRGLIFVVSLRRVEFCTCGVKPAHCIHKCVEAHCIAASIEQAKQELRRLQEQMAGHKIEGDGASINLVGTSLRSLVNTVVSSEFAGLTADSIRQAEGDRQAHLDRMRRRFSELFEAQVEALEAANVFVASLVQNLKMLLPERA